MFNSPFVSGKRVTISWHPDQLQNGLGGQVCRHPSREREILDLSPLTMVESYQ